MREMAASDEMTSDRREWRKRRLKKGRKKKTYIPLKLYHPRRRDVSDPTRNPNFTK
jgi:hypothetical protein